MLNVRQLQEDRTLVNNIDWTMTPEKAVEMYLEWGSGWTRGNDFVASANDESYYFVLFDWETDPPVVTLLHRTLEGADELAKIEVPKELFDASCLEAGSRPGGTVQPLNRMLKDWVNDLIHGPTIEHFNTEH